MLQRIFMNTIYTKAILVMTITGVLLRMITIFSYKRMKNAAENAGKTKKQWVQVLKKRFENYQRFGRIGNVEAFVEHYFFRKGILGIPLGFWDKSTSILSLAVFLTGMFGAVSFYLEGRSQEEIVLSLFSGMFAGTMLSLVQLLGDTKAAKHKILVSLIDYFSNGMVQRKGEEAYDVPTKEEVEGLSEAAVTDVEKQILSDVLEEYFW